MLRLRFLLPPALTLAVGTLAVTADAWTPLPVVDDPLVRMPGTQQNDGVALEISSNCMGCHDNYDASVDVGHHWRGSMMSQAARDPLFWAAMTVAMQDSIWAIGRPNAADLCLRCHSPAGWLGGRSDPPNGSFLAFADFDGVSCESCHQMYDAHFEDTFAGTREGGDWVGYWDEAGSQSLMDAMTTLSDDAAEASGVGFFNGNPYFDGMNQPPGSYTEAAGGQLFVSSQNQRRGSFADANANHGVRYSRFHKSRYYCASCHDVSNPVLVNLPFEGTPPGDATTVLPSETQPAHSYGHIERTFSEFMLSDFGLGAGAPGSGAFDPSVFDTSRPGDVIASCQDCHMADAVGKGCSKSNALVRPTESAEHPKSGQPLHDLTGGNLWIPAILASTVPSSPNYDPTNESLLAQGPAVLTMDLSAGLGVEPAALLDGVARAQAMLEAAATIDDLTYDGVTGALSFRVTNHSGHKLISGYPEGRRMFVNVRLFSGNQILHEVNPYDHGVSTLKGLPPSASPMSPALSPNESHEDALVYEAKMSSTLTGEATTFHMTLSDGRYKDNRIPPRGFRIMEAAARLSEPYAAGMAAPGLYSAAEYAGGYDEVALTLPSGATSVQVRLYYQTTSREYVQFLEDEIEGTATTLASPTPSGEPYAYVAQTDPFFGQLAAWGATIWQLWDHNRHLPGAAPILMTEATIGMVPGPCEIVGSDGTPCDDGDPCTVDDTCMGGACQGALKECAPENDCHDPGVCDPVDGSCSELVKPDGSPCPGGGVCMDGQCVSGGTGGAGEGGVGGTGAMGGAGGTGVGGSPAGAGGDAVGGSTTPGGPDLAPAEDGGCGCVTVGDHVPSTATGWWLLALAGAAGVARRPRRRRSDV